MNRKSPLSKDAFDWIQDTTKAAGEKNETETKSVKPAKHTVPEIQKPPAIKKMPGESVRFVFVRYKDNGNIVGMVEVIKGEKKPDIHPYLNVPADEKVAGFSLTGELAAMPLIEIHNNYKVITTGAKPRLTPKA